MNSAGRAPEKAITAALLAIMAVTFFFGLWCSLHVGLTWDEMYEQKTLAMNVAAIQGLMAGDKAAYNELIDYRDKYYGIGFHLLIWPLQALIAPFVGEEFGIDDASAMLLAKHPLVFLTFTGSAVLFYRLLRVFITRAWVCLLFTATYYLYPYLFGYALINVKDIPFLFAYLLCTWYSLRLAVPLLHDRPAGLRRLVFLVVLTAWLMAIRIGGILILGQYLFTFLLVWGERQGDKKAQLKRFLFLSLLFLLMLSFLVVLAYPVFWVHPGKVIDALMYMSKLPFSFHTLTFGAHLSDQALPTYYIPAWLLVKLPLAFILSIPLTFAVLKRIALENKTHLIYLGTFLFVVLFVPVYLTIAKVALYNELRQMLFIIPFFLLLGLISLYYISPRASVAIAIFYLVLFTADGLLMRPYQYVWFNEAARFMDMDKNFETDYWGASGREIAHVEQLNTKALPSVCFYINPQHLFRPFLPFGNQCVLSQAVLNKDTPRPFFMTFYKSDNPKLPAGCESAYKATRSLLFSRPVTMAGIAYCH